jgi:hypothetical protein
MLLNNLIDSVVYLSSYNYVSFRYTMLKLVK